MSLVAIHHNYSGVTEKNFRENCNFRSNRFTQ